MTALLIGVAVWYAASIGVAATLPAATIGAVAGWLVAIRFWIPQTKRSISRGTAGAERLHPVILPLAIGVGLVVLPAATRGMDPTIHAQLAVAALTFFGVSLGLVARDQELMARLDSVLKARRRGSP